MKLKLESSEEADGRLRPGWIVQLSTDAPGIVVMVVGNNEPDALLAAEKILRANMYHDWLVERLESLFTLARSYKDLEADNPSSLEAARILIASVKGPKP